MTRYEHPAYPPPTPAMQLRCRHLISLTAGLLVWVCIVGGIIASVQAVAGGVEQFDPVVTDFADYPANSGAPDGCDTAGVTGLSYTVNDGDPVADLQNIGPVRAGDVVTATWVDVAAVCDGSPVAIAIKSAPGPTFDPTADQAMVPPYGSETLTAGTGGSVSFTLPSLERAFYRGCYGQIDAILGNPLHIVGPSGSYYGAALRGGGPNLLLSAWNGGYDFCFRSPTPTPPTTALPTTTTAPTPVTTPGEDASPTPTAPPAVEGDASDGGGPQDVNPPTTPAPSVAPTDDLAPAVSVAGVSLTRADLPNTGSSSWTLGLLLIALAALAVGIPVTKVTRNHIGHRS